MTFPQKYEAVQHHVILKTGVTMSIAMTGINYIEIINKTSTVVCYSEHKHYLYSSIPCRAVHVLTLAMPVIRTCAGVTQRFLHHTNLWLKTTHRLMLLTCTDTADHMLAKTLLE